MASFRVLVERGANLEAFPSVRNFLDRDPPDHRGLNGIRFSESKSRLGLSGFFSGCPAQTMPHI